MANWRSVPGYVRYEISDQGQIRNIVSGKFLRPIVHSGGYVYVCLHYAVQKHRLELVHRLVLRAFVGEPPAGHETRHLDGVRTNNQLYNLAWGTKAENVADIDRHGTRAYGIRTAPKNPARGEANAAAKLTVSAVKYIRKLLECGFTMRDAADEFGITKSTVFSIKHRHIWAHG